MCLLASELTVPQEKEEVVTTEPSFHSESGNFKHCNTAKFSQKSEKKKNVALFYLMIFFSYFSV